MWRSDTYVTDHTEPFVCIDATDIEDAAAGVYCSEANIAIEMDAIQALPYFRSVQNLVLLPGGLTQPCSHYFDDCPATALKIDYYTDIEDEYTVDISPMPNLQYVFSRSLLGFRNANQCPNLKAIKVGEWKTQNFLQLGDTGIEALQILKGSLQSLAGVQALTKLRFLSISNCKRIEDFTELSTCHSLESLVLENCGSKITETMPVIQSLKYLNIHTSILPNAEWFERFPNLQYLTIDAKLEDGKIDRLQDLKHCVLVTDRRHYTLRNKDLPKSSVSLPKDAYHFELPAIHA